MLFAACARARQEGRNPLHISAVLVAEFLQRFSLLDPRQPHIHDHQHRKHQQRQDRRPLQQEAEHDDDKPDILWVPNILVDARRRQYMPALRAIENLPRCRQQDEAAKDCRNAQHMQDAPMRIAMQTKQR